LERCDLLISPKVYLELECIRGRQTMGNGPDRIFAEISSAFGVQICPMPFAPVGMLAAQLSWTTDPFDRIIVANAWANQEALLISRTRTCWPTTAARSGS
jgi:PIN domain nuclease of toxin-antitoxin system